MPGQARAQNVSPGGHDASLLLRPRLDFCFLHLPPVILAIVCAFLTNPSASIPQYSHIVFSRTTQKEISACPRNLPLASKKSFKW